ncbi:RNA-splicing factor, partial [Homalodisca vitripennis]
ENRKPLLQEDVKKQKIEPKRKLTEEEKQLKLKEMMSNAKWRDDLRDKNIKAHEEKLKTEKDDYVYNEDFMRNQMAYAMSQETVESRVKANVNSIQRSGRAMNENFAKRN